MVNAGKPVELKVMEDAAGNVRVPGLTTKYVTGARHAMEHQIRGSALRTKAGTKLNASSSRSHAVFTVMLCEHQQHQQENQTESERNRYGI
jgi:kinesin family protein 4/21/27